MILVRDIFRLKFGKAKEAKDLMKNVREVAAKEKIKFGKAMTDVTGPSYTLVLEIEFESLSDFENSIKKVFSNEEWKKWYQKFAPLVENSSREIYTLID